MNTANTSPDHAHYFFSKRLPLLALCLLPLTLSAASILANGQEKGRRPYRYLIPEGYVGWVRVDFNVKDAPELPIEDGYYLLKIPPTGYLQTSSDDDDPKLHIAEYYYVCGEARHRLIVNTGLDECRIWQKFSGYIGGYQLDDRPLKYRYLFVGLRDEYHRERYIGGNLHRIALGEDGYPKPGSKSNLICQKD
jgi:hypothetical protein